MSWRAASSFPYKVSRPAQSKQAMPSKYPARRHTRGVSRAAPRPEFLSPTLWRRESPWHLQPDGYRPGMRIRLGEAAHERRERGGSAASETFRGAKDRSLPDDHDRPGRPKELWWSSLAFAFRSINLTPQPLGVLL